MTANDPSRIEQTEKFVRDILRVWDRHDAADNPQWVNQIARKIVRALPIWTHPHSPLKPRRS